MNTLNSKKNGETTQPKILISDIIRERIEGLRNISLNNFKSAKNEKSYTGKKSKNALADRLRASYLELEELLEKIQPIEEKQQKYILELEQHQHPKYYHENSIN